MLTNVQDTIKNNISCVLNMQCFTHSVMYIELIYKYICIIAIVHFQGFLSDYSVIVVNILKSRSLIVGISISPFILSVIALCSWKLCY